VLKSSFDAEEAVGSAWRHVCPNAQSATAIEILNETRKCGVYRLTGTGVIAKRALQTALIEPSSIKTKLPVYRCPTGSP
jgi:hypothetical protein